MAIGDVLLVSLFALQGWLMAALPIGRVGLLLACAAFAVVLDEAKAKRIVFPRSAIV